ncbi:MAG: hypothetical protein ACRDHO_01420 [Actinomycetota bacterium]
MRRPAAVVLAVLALLLAACEVEDPGQGGAIRTTAPSPASDDSTGTPEEEPETTAPPPKILKGSGAKVQRLKVAADSPLVVTGRHSGSSNFIVELVAGGDSILLFNEIGTFREQTAVAEIEAKAYRVRVDADGTWRLRFEQPVPTAGAKEIPGTLRGKGAKVVPIQTLEDIQPTVAASHSGEANFIVTLIGYGDLRGEILVFNEIGEFQGETIVDEELAPAGYLLYVQADGTWRLRFSR